MGFQTIINFANDESGANAVEYAILAGVISVAIGVVVLDVSDALASSLQGICNTVAGVVGAGGC
ncbi:MAG: Flp family type IVb pilin [Burkholderiaceae bacterium]